MKLLLREYDKKGKVAYRYDSANKNRFSQRLSLALKHRSEISKWFIRVIYKRGYENAGFYQTSKELLRAYKMFTEPSLIKYIGGER